MAVRLCMLLFAVFLVGATAQADQLRTPDPAVSATLGKLAKGLSRKLFLELNSLTAITPDIFRLTFVATSKLIQVLTDIEWQIAWFDDTGVVRRIISLQFDALGAGRTRMLGFDLQRLRRDALARIVVNDAPSCVIGDGQHSQICLTYLSLENRTSIRFGF